MRKPIGQSPIAQTQDSSGSLLEIPWVPRNPHKPQWQDFTFRDPRRNQKPAQEHNPVFEGWDSETIQAPKWGSLRGNAFVICNSTNTLRLNIAKGKDNIKDILDFFMEGARKMNAWWNIDYDVRTIFKWNPELLLELYPENNGIGEATVDEYDIVYFKKKFFSLSNTRLRRKAMFYDASLFYQQGLGSAAWRYLKRESPAMKAHRGEDLYSKYLDNPQEVMDYCKWDATATKDLMALFITKLQRMDFYPKKPISCGYLAQDYLRTNADLPHVYDASGTINRPAWEAFMGGWIDVWKRGTFHDIQKWDINSAYPWAMENLPDIRDGEWREELIPEAPLGFVLCVLKQTKEAIPCVASWLRSVHGYPVYDISMKKWITVQEYNILKRLPGNEIKAIRAWCFIPKPNARTPFKIPVKSMLGFKNISHPKRGTEPDEAVYLASKMIFNSFYGKTCERVRMGDKWRAGKLFNPIYASTITAKCRVLLLEAIAQNPSAIISIATDCIAVTSKFRLPEHDTELGKWKLECEGATGTFVFPGIYEIESHATHSRGFRIPTCACGHESKNHTGNCSYCGCSKFNPSLVKLMERSNGQALEIRIERPWGVREAFRQSDMDMVGVFEEKVYDKGIDSVRRLWLESPETFRDLLHKQYGSVPLPVSITSPGLWQYGDMEETEA